MTTSIFEGRGPPKNKAQIPKLQSKQSGPHLGSVRI